MTFTWTKCIISVSKYCIKGNVNVCLIFLNLPNGFETGTIKTLSLIIFVGRVRQAMHVYRLSSKAGVFNAQKSTNNDRN